MVATYSGSSDGVYLPSEATATVHIPECTGKLSEIAHHVEGVAGARPPADYKQGKSIVITSFYAL